MHVNLLENDAAPVPMTHVGPGKEFSVALTGTFGSGTLTILADLGAATPTAITDADLSSAVNCIIFVNPADSGLLYYQLTGASSPDLHLNVVPLISRTS